MIGLSSRNAGVLLIPKSGTDGYSIIDVVAGKEKDHIEAQYLYSVAQDWQEIKGTDTGALLKAATYEYWLTRAVSLLREVLGGLEKSLEKRVLEHIEEILSSRASSEKALDRLLVAPLRDSDSPLKPAKSALSYGFLAVASILDELTDLQPLLNRLTDLWLSLEETAFSQFLESRETIWMTVIEKGKIKQLLKADSGKNFRNEWNLLAYHFTAHQSRSGISSIGQELSRQLFPNEKSQREIIIDAEIEIEKNEYNCNKKQTIRDCEAYDRAMKQINAIARLVSKGHDAKAKKFLRELIQQQISFSSEVSYVVKSLCNIAQLCAEMFRMDFEFICLEKALQLDPSDAWALVQYGDHMKRVGNYTEALESFKKAGQFGESIVAKSSEADVYSQQGNYPKAIETYKNIMGWNNRLEVLTAIADNLRKMGHIEESKAAYTELIDRAEQGWLEFINGEVRSKVGLAEIAKQRGEYEDALLIYNEILKRNDIDDREKIIYNLGLCNILKLMDKFNEAYEIVDEIIRKYPFVMQARFIRGSILGLIGKEIDGLVDLPESSGSHSWQGWLLNYYRGLLLFKLERYDEAKENLIERLNQAVASGEDKAILRMAAALCFLRENKTAEVDEHMSQIPELHDCHIQYLSLVLKLHSATLKKDLAMMSSLKKHIAGLEVVDTGLEKAVEALNKGNYSLALTCEINILLKLAA